MKCGGARGEMGTARGPSRKSKGWIQAPGTQLPSYTLLVSTSTGVGGQGASEEGTAISIHLDCFLATKVRSDGCLGPSQTRTSARGSGVGQQPFWSESPRCRPMLVGGGGDSAPAGVWGGTWHPTPAAAPQEWFSVTARPPPLRDGCRERPSLGQCPLEAVNRT